MQILFLNVPYAQMKVILVLTNESILTVMKQIWTRMFIFCKWRAKVVKVNTITVAKWPAAGQGRNKLNDRRS